MSFLVFMLLLTTEYTPIGHKERKLMMPCSTFASHAIHFSLN